MHGFWFPTMYSRVSFLDYAWFQDFEAFFRRIQDFQSFELSSMRIVCRKEYYYLFDEL